MIQFHIMHPGKCCSIWYSVFYEVHICKGENKIQLVTFKVFPRLNLQFTRKLETMMQIKFHHEGINRQIQNFF